MGNLFSGGESKAAGDRCPASPKGAAVPPSAPDSSSASASACASSACAATVPDSSSASASAVPESPAASAASTASTADEAKNSAFNLDALRAEIEDIRANPPPYVSQVGSLSIPTFILEDDQLTKPSGQGPWDFTAAVSGALTAEEEAACEAAKAQATELRFSARIATQELARGERKLADARKVFGEVERRAGQEEEQGVRALFRRLPSVGTWLVPQRDEALVDDAALEEAASAVQAAEAEVQELREKESQALKEARKVERSASRSKNAEAYAFPFRVRIRFEASQWPFTLSDADGVRFQCVIHHALIDDDHHFMLEPFYKTLPRKDSVTLTVRGVLQAVHRFLVDPLEAWGIPEDSAPMRLHQEMASNRQENERRLSTIRKYSKLVAHEELFQTPARWQAILTEHLPGEVFSFKVFTEDFCKTFVEEIFNFYDCGLPARRPNSMNNYGIILNEIGLEPMIDELQRMLQPLGELLWPGPGSVWDGHHCFIVRYRENEDLGLDMHTDDSDVTFNICLGLDFDGAGLQFCGLMGAGNHRKHTHTYKHVKGTCVCHLGRKRHGADDISSGERLNLILWNHSSTYRQSKEYNDPDYVKEEGPPDQVCVSYTHDRDYGNFKEYPKGKERFKGRGWCPPKPYEYPGFKTDAD
eukprot:CAMPEP_0115571040 /NCGR_PEP_ID=MMETSP0271-20121206/106008_1 /TAXON_ID=71861 /ORGANISM="Scrippsiella trochoidea, Strain CCMP3099" /LENGTH=645 /DNA_ID=CAMNT_0003005593 /DNA_START=14 /DNA_END=1951 /DNA_ORIENTATION=-